MIISTTYGPQFDSNDGTIGKLQLVKRYAITTHDGMFWGTRQGQRTKATKAAAQHDLDIVRANNPPAAYPPGLTVGAWWCYPTHFDPVGPTAAPTPVASRCEVTKTLDN